MPNAEHALYLETGPQHKKTLVHVLDLLGCVVPADTTDAAVHHVSAITFRLRSRGSLRRPSLIA